MAKRSCSVDGCERPYRCHGYCAMHLGRVQRNGTSDEPTWRVGDPQTAERRSNLSAKKMGEKNPMFGKTRDRHPNWKGDKVGYMGIHDWMTYYYGQPKHCEECGTTDPDKRYEWANISGEYRRDREDFKRLCKLCHNILDGVSVKQQAGADEPQKFQPMKKIKGKPVSSRYKGVRASGYGTWRASVMIKGRRMNLGTFATEELAAAAYNEAVREVYGDAAYLNEIVA